MTHSPASCGHEIVVAVDAAAAVGGADEMGGEDKYALTPHEALMVCCRLTRAAQNPSTIQPPYPARRRCTVLALVAAHEIRTAKQLPQMLCFLRYQGRTSCWQLGARIRR